MICIWKRKIDDLRVKICSAMKIATGDSQRDLEILLFDCDETLTHVSDYPQYEGGKLEAGFANPMLQEAADFRTKNPGLLE